MALSSGIFSTFLVPETASFSTLSSPFSASALSVRFANVRTAHTVTSATASKPASTNREPRGIMKPRPVSPEMQAIVGVPEISRTQVLKEIWAYIKSNNLQDPNDKKIIVCDEKLKKIFGKDRVGFLEVARLISPHFL